MPFVINKMYTEELYFLFKETIHLTL